MRLVEQFSRLERSIEATWSRLELELVLADEGLMDRAAALLGPANPGRVGNRLRFATARHGRGIGPEALRRLLTRLDEEGIEGRLQLHDLERAPSGERSARESMHDQWTRALTALPSDWSDVYAELRLDSSDYVEPAALLLAPVNPSSFDVATLRFRCARRFGYGVSPEMAARCLQRCDDRGITGNVEILRVLSDTDPVATQGPVWLVGGRVV